MHLRYLLVTLFYPTLGCFYPFYHYQHLYTITTAFIFIIKHIHHHPLHYTIIIVTNVNITLSIIIYITQILSHYSLNLHSLK